MAWRNTATGDINKERKYVLPEYNFIDKEKLLKLNKKKYTVEELRDIAFKEHTVFLKQDVIERTLVVKELCEKIWWI